jgi:hypothetical protein
VEIYGGALVALLVLVMIVYVVPKVMGGNQIVCTRCEGTGQIDERWPDPAQPTGFHVATGKCPKCKGKGRLKA